MPTVQRTFCTVDRHINICVATHAKNCLLATGLMDGTVADDPGIRGEQVFVKRYDFAEVRRARFLFALEKEFDVRSWFDSTCFQRVEGGEDSHHSGLVIRSRTR